MLNSHPGLNFEVIKKADNSRYANGIDIRLLNLGQVALFSNFKLTKTSGKHSENISHARIGSLLYKLITSAKNTDDLSLGFYHDRNMRRDKLTNIKHIKGKYLLRFMFKNVFSFAENQEKATYGLG